MTYNPLVSVQTPEALEPAVKYAAALDQFNRHAANVMTYLYFASPAKADAKDEFADALNIYRLALATDKENPLLSLEARVALMTTAAHYGLNDTDLEEFSGWLNQFAFYASNLYVAESNLIEAMNRK